jgi:hypothetical protein
MRGEEKGDESESQKEKSSSSSRKRSYSETSMEAGANEVTSQAAYKVAGKFFILHRYRNALINPLDQLRRLEPSLKLRCVTEVTVNTVILQFSVTSYNLSFTIQ